MHKVHAVPRRTTVVHTVPRCSTEVHKVQTMCYVPTHSTTRNYTITSDSSGTYGTNGGLRTETRYNTKLYHYALHGEILHKVHAVPCRTTEVHTVPRCSTEVHKVQTMCYVPTHSTTKLHHYALHGAVLHKVHAIPRRTTQVHMIQTVCYVPKYGTTQNYAITHCTARYCTKYTR